MWPETCDQHSVWVSTGNGRKVVLMLMELLLFTVNFLQRCSAEVSLRLLLPCCTFFGLRMTVSILKQRWQAERIYICKHKVDFAVTVDTAALLPFSCSTGLVNSYCKLCCVPAGDGNTHHIDMEGLLAGRTKLQTSEILMSVSYTRNQIFSP